MELCYFSSGPRERVLEAILKAGHTVERVFLTDPQAWPKVRSTMALAEARQIPVSIIKRRELPDLGRELAGKVCLSVGFGYLFPEAFLRELKICLNVHGTLLPHYGGARTLNWVIENGESESGVTVHQVDSGIDTGPILLQKKFALSPFDTGPSLARKTLAFEPQVVTEALALYESGDANFTPQACTGVIQHVNRVPEHSEIDPAQSLLALYNQIRAADPERYPAYFYINGEKICVRLWRPDKPSGEEDML